MDERGGLESRCGLRVTVGSNPTPSARVMSAGLRASRYVGAAVAGIDSATFAAVRIVTGMPDNAAVPVSRSTN